MAGPDRSSTHTDYTPIGLVNADPAGIKVRADSPYKIGEGPARGHQGEPRQDEGLGHRAGRHLAPRHRRPAEATRGIDPNALPWVPSNGAAPGLQDMVAGGVDVVPCSIPEARSLIDAGKVKRLAIMDDEAAGAVSQRADAQEGARQRLGDRPRGAASPRPRAFRPTCTKTLVARAARRSTTRKEYKEFMASRGFGVDLGRSGRTRRSSWRSPTPTSARR